MNFLKYLTAFVLVPAIAVLLTFSYPGGRGLVIMVYAMTALFVLGVVMALIVARIHRRNIKVAVSVAAAYLVLIVSFPVYIHITNSVMPACQKQVKQQFMASRDVDLYDRWCVSDRLDYYFFKVAEDAFDEALFNALLDKGLRHRNIECARLKFAVYKGDLAATRGLIDKGVKAACVSSNSRPIDVLQSGAAQDSLSDEVRQKLLKILLADANSTIRIDPDNTDPKMIETMIDSGMSISIKDINEAIRRSNHAALSEMVKHIDVNTGDQTLPHRYTMNDIENPLLLAVSLADLDSVKTLLAAGANPNQRIFIKSHPAVREADKATDIYNYAMFLHRQADNKASSNTTAERDKQKYYKLAGRYNAIVSNLKETYTLHPAFVAEKQEELARQQALEEQQRLAWKEQLKSQYGVYSSPAKPVYFLRDAFMDNTQLTSPSMLSCRSDLLRFYASELRALRKQSQQPGGQTAHSSPDSSELREFLFGHSACREFDPRLTYWGLIVEGASAKWRPIDLQVELKFRLMPEVCGSDDVPMAELSLSLPQALLITGVPRNIEVNKTLHQRLEPVEEVAARSTAGSELIELSTPELGNIKKASIEKRFATWISDEPPLREQVVIDRARLFVEVLDQGKIRRLQIFEDKGAGKYGYVDADITDVHIIDADFDGDIDILLSSSQGGRYLILFDGNKPGKEPIVLQRPETPLMVGGC